MQEEPIDVSEAPQVHQGFVSPYTPEHKEACLQWVSDNVVAGTLRATLKQASLDFHIPWKTIERWWNDLRLGREERRASARSTARAMSVPKVLQNTLPSSREIKMLPREEMAELFQTIVVEYARMLSREDVIKAVRKQPQRAVVVMGIAFDKLQVLRGEPTSISEQRAVRYMEPGSLRRYVEQLEVLESVTVTEQELSTPQEEEEEDAIDVRAETDGLEDEAAAVNE